MVDICRYTALILIIGTKTYGSERHFCFVLFIYLFVCVGGGGDSFLDTGIVLMVRICCVFFTQARLLAFHGLLLIPT